MSLYYSPSHQRDHKNSIQKTWIKLLECRYELFEASNILMEQTSENSQVKLKYMFCFEDKI